MRPEIRERLIKALQVRGTASDAYLQGLIDGIDATVAGEQGDLLAVALQALRL